MLKGPSSGLYGQTSPGGLINMVSKRPTAETLRRGRSARPAASTACRARSISAGRSTSERRVSLSPRRPRARRPTPQIDFTQREAQLFIAPSFTWQPTADTTLHGARAATSTIDINGQLQQYRARRYGTLLPNPNGRIPYSRYIGEPELRPLSSSSRLRSATRSSIASTTSSSSARTLRYADVSIDMFSMRTERPGRRLSDDWCARTLNYVTPTCSKRRASTTSFRPTSSPARCATRCCSASTTQNADSPDRLSRTGCRLPDRRLQPGLWQRRADQGHAVAVHQTAIDSRTSSASTCRTRSSSTAGSLTLTGRHDRATSGRSRLSFRIGAAISQDDTASTGRVGLNYVFDNGFAPYVSYSTSFEPVGRLLTSAAASRSSRPPAKASRSASSISRPASNMLFTAVGVRHHAEERADRRPDQSVRSACRPARCACAASSSRPSGNSRANSRSPAATAISIRT